MGTTVTKIHYLPGFSRPPEAQPDTPQKETRVLFNENSVPISGRSPISRDTNSYKEKITLPRVLLSKTSPSSVGVLPREEHLVPKDLSPFRVWGYYPFFLSVRAARHTRACVCGFSADGPSLRNGFLLPILGPTTHVQTAVHMATLLQLHPSGFSLEVFATTTDLHRWRLPGGSRPAPSTHAPRPSYSLRRKNPTTREALPSGPGKGPQRWSVHPFSWLVASVGEFVYTLLSEFPTSMAIVRLSEQPPLSMGVS
ncbi:hypothetical protein JTE90_010537 [Oedothorax gibbosus]|uniref:Uncharacterized protein n=1 Tax=Oedothorax gibbosus TaxID=931172 RepID=A0AAV6TJR8_9ARAC|nr:hypothetical protein JTE90_010537 [Oedothorax gibbosus]